MNEIVRLVFAGAALSKLQRNEEAEKVRGTRAQLLARYQR